MRLPRLTVSVVLVWASGLLGCASDAEPVVGQRPNIVLILADDLGWKDVGYNGSAYATPNIDALARTGMHFTQAYAVSPCCSPTRASVLSGLHPARLQLTRAIRLSDVNAEGAPVRERKWIAPDSLSHLPNDAESLATRLAAAGYETGFVGKWHLGLPPHTPERFGFGHASAVGYHSACPYFAPYKSMLDVPEAPWGESLTMRLTEEAIDFLDKERETPFFLLLSHFAVHGPWQAHPDDEARLQKTLDPDSPQGNATYASMLEGLDISVGRIVAKLEELGVIDNTLLVFLSDNGPTLNKGQRQLTSTAPLKGGKLDLYEGGIRVPLLMSWPGTIEAGSTNQGLVSSMDLYSSFLSLAGVGEIRAGDGADLAPGLLGGEWPVRDTLYFHFPHRSFTSAVRVGNLKLIHHQQGEAAELYDLEADIGEAHDIAAERPTEVARLEALLLRYLEQIGAQFPERKSP